MKEKEKRGREGREGRREKGGQGGKRPFELKCWSGAPAEGVGVEEEVGPRMEEPSLIAGVNPTAGRRKITNHSQVN